MSSDICVILRVFPGVYHTVVLARNFVLWKFSEMLLLVSGAVAHIFSALLLHVTLQDRVTALLSDEWEHAP